MSNKTPENSDAKTASAPKASPSVIISLCLAAIVLLLGAVFFSLLNDRTVTINGKRFTVTVADSPEERQQGLSGRDRLNDSEGMLFEFDSDGVYCFWMKDMQFAIDMIWLDKNKKVVHIQENAAPESYPESFCPETEARYVLEIKNGGVKANSITVGDQASF